MNIESGHFAWLQTTQRLPNFQCAVGPGPLVLVQLTLGFHSLYLMEVLEMFLFGPQTRVKPNKPNKNVKILQVEMKT